MNIMYRCPQCKDRHLYVEVTVMAMVDQTRDFLATAIPAGSEVSDKRNHCHQWDGSHTMKCGNCGYTSAPYAFAVEPDTKHDHQIRAQTRLSDVLGPIPPTFPRPSYGRMFLFEQDESVPYSPYLLAFVHEGDEYRDPYTAQADMFEVDPETEYGFEVIDTGGGCKALAKMTDDGRELWITDPSGCHVPDITRRPVEGILGLRIGGQTVAWIDLRDIPNEGDYCGMTKIMDELDALLAKVNGTFDGGDWVEALCRIVNVVNKRIASLNNAHL